MNFEDTIIAPATPEGKSGIGILRISGKKSKNIAQTVLGTIPKPRKAVYLNFLNFDQSILDKGIAIWYPKPFSFTGEDVLELQGHGNFFLMDLLIKRILLIPNVRIAQPGEFTKRSFLNKKIDLSQAEGIADLINSESELEAQSSLKLMSGFLKKYILNVKKNIYELQAMLEMDLNFSEENYLNLDINHLEKKIKNIFDILQKIKYTEYQGKILKKGINISIIGPPNSGKSTLLNQLALKKIAIVTEIPGTTRDILEHHININNIPFIISDTAGIRNNVENRIEKIGIKLTHKEIKKSDHLLIVIDIQKYYKNNKFYLNLIKKIKNNKPYTVILNKSDLISTKPTIKIINKNYFIILSAKNGLGIDILKSHIVKKYSFKQTNEKIFLSRRRHLNIFKKIYYEFFQGVKNWKKNKNSELFAESLRTINIFLEEIQGNQSSETVLNKIFSKFCIGK
ncbi:tRNA uridine-5-carboxymethylaminomethyl(34) synthesis GTPase MnmE [Buchnera aphidicola (Kurisakia onigurumii)]|uniref:tRNA uridine-5-carboxymethylaminomethyl(34) synthesis GTPase MnmE n=1 Tax=Buchnera aphidicola TaxID=9 RepID=UPI0031B6ACBC